MTNAASAIDNALARWRNNLIDLSRRNPLLHLRPTRSSYLVVSHPGVQNLYERLQAGKAWSFWMPPVDEDDDAEPTPRPVSLERYQPKAHELVCADLGRKRLVQVLTNLYRRALTDFQERGLHILHLACGVLEWRADDDAEPFRSPLVLVPVELVRKSLQEPFTVAPADEEIVVNPALAARLQQDFDFRLPAFDPEEEGKTLTGYLDEVKAAVAGLPGWSVEPSAVLTLFSFFKGVMYRDLLDNAGHVAAHPLVCALAGAAPPEEPGEPIPEEELDAIQPPEKTFHILDADGSQRLCLEAAARGHSFVLHGPPGTGKSQTIANLIAACLAGGKSVLFVSEKMAALDVVYKRLRQVGLGDFCLELHSHKASKREVVAELRRCLEQPRRPRPGGGADGEKLRAIRDRLNGYAEALHRPRDPFQRSAWWALGELARCHDLPTVPLQVAEDTDRTPAWLEEARQALQRARQLWHVRGAPDFPWRGFKLERYNLQLRDEVIGLVEKARTRLDRLAAAAGQYGKLLGAEGPVAWLLRVADHLEATPRPPARWLTEPDLAALSADLDRCAEQYQQRAGAREPLTNRYGPAVWLLDEGTAAKAADAWRQARPLLAPGDDRGANYLKLQQQLRGWAADTHRRLPGWLGEARILEKWLGLALPAGYLAERGADRNSPSVGGLRRLLRLANLCQSETPPERSWLVDPAALRQARELLGEFRPVLAGYRAARADLLGRYTEQLFELDLDRLAEDFPPRYHSWLRFFSGPFRSDRRSIARRTPGRALPRTVVEDLGKARDLVRTQRKVEEDAARRKPVLGRYEKGLSTDPERVEKALRVAADAAEVAGQLGCDGVPGKLADALSQAQAVPEKARAAAKRLHDSLALWLQHTHELESVLPVAMFPGTAHPLEELAVSALQDYAKDLQRSLNHLASLIDPMLTRAVSPPPDTEALLADLREAEALRAQEAKQETEAARWRERLGPAFQGIATDWAALRRSLTWAQRLRGQFDERGLALPAEAARAATGEAKPPASKDLRSAHEQLAQAVHSLEVRFEPPGPSWGGRRIGELTLDELKRYLHNLRERVGELGDWSDWRLLRERFAHLGLAAYWQALQQAELPAERLPDLFLKSVLSEWAEGIFREDAALGGFRRDSHEHALGEFQELDRQAVGAAAGRVAGQADARRPLASDAAPGSELALLLREAHKKTRHLPIRRLCEEIPNLLLQVKPCLLMSPLSVSQFLPPETLTFDLVVFDEASQILPEDAVGAIYRGRQAVICGDDRQLPPTAFFQQNAEHDEAEGEEDEVPASFESVLDACLGAGLRPHMLRWHYRSRHESLIAYANRNFYDNRLVTFPAARSGRAAGVELRHVPDGVYDRGGRRDNVREAQVVADLVFEHVRTHGERKTLGVIAFSQAQQAAIADEVERRLREQPSLEPLFTQDRLEGFFVKNLETVQGDERDAIVLSVGYGRDAAGKLTMHFGPLNREGGERRLNVAVTRAREKLVVVSSLRAADIDAGTKAAGVAHLRGYLEHAERGAESLPPVLSQAEGEPSALEREVLAEVRRLGYEAVPRVGCGEYRIDIGVHEPGAPGQFLLGVECDGPGYHAAGTARDRDRLREEVLAKLGWRLHRVWSPAWLNRREEEVARLEAALEEARQARPAAPEPALPPPAAQAPAPPKPAPPKETKDVRKSTKRR